MARKVREEARIDDVINTFGCTRFSCGLVFIVGILWMSESVETNLISLIAPRFRCMWNLSSLETSLTSSTVFLGNGIGSLYFGYFADAHGRKIVMIAGAALTVYFGLISAAAPNFIWFLILRFFVGLGLGPVQLGACYISEWIMQKHRGKSVISVDLFYAVGSIYVSTIALLLTSWRVFLVASVLPGVLFLLLSAWLPESVRYLQNTGNCDNIVKVLHRMSLASGKPLPQNVNLECRAIAERGHFAVLLNKKYRGLLVIIGVLFVSSFWGYFGIVLLNTEILQSGGACLLNVAQKTIGCTKLSNADYIQNILVASGEIPGLLLAALAVDTLGRKVYTTTAFVAAGMGFLVLNICLSGLSRAIHMYAMRFVLIGLAQVPYLFAAELFPTTVRASALGIIMFVCKISLVGVPFLVQILSHVSFISMTIIFSGLCFCSAVLVLLLPETKNTPLVNVHTLPKECS